MQVAQVRNSLKPLGLDNEPIQESLQGGRNFLTLRLPLNTSEKVESTIRGAIPNGQFKVEREERVGALVGGELAKSSLWALGLGIFGILIYVTFRFELSFAVGAIVALLHDVLITVGVFSLMGRELTLPLVGAILTIAGYSINDTIVVYDRIREGLASGRRGTIEQIMNESINQTLSRTILTSTVTLIPILCLFLFGGAVLRDFSLAIIIGVVVGTYSSIFIASPIVLWWTRARGGSASSLAPGSDPEIRGHDPDDGRLIRRLFRLKKMRDNRKASLLRQRAMRLTLALFFLLITGSYSDTLVTFTLSWEAPATGAVTGYNIYMGERSSVVGNDVRDLRLYAGRIALANQLNVPVFLTHPTTYFTITAVNGAGEGPPSNELVVTMNGSMATVEPPGDRLKPLDYPTKTSG